MRITTSGIACREGTYLLALRKAGSSIGESWEFPGGKHRSSTETPEETLQREFREELGVPVRVGELIMTTAFSNNGKTYRLQAYRIELEHEDFQLTEHQRTGWFAPEQILELPLAASDRAVAEYLAKSPFPKE